MGMEKILSTKHNYRLPPEKADRIRLSPPPVMTLMEAAAYMTCSPRKLRELITLQRIKCAKIGARIIIKREWLDSFLGV